VKRIPDVAKALRALPQTCSLDVAETPYLDVSGGRHMTLKEIGELLGITRERVRQIELDGLREVQEFVMSEIDEWLDRWERS
jgi:DNA-directed RNA polymerase sigma subunit (sigma70/sigma32)